jgi:AcrR family transcriptional regulator
MTGMSTALEQPQRDLPPELARILFTGSGGSKRERTRRQLLASAVRVLSERGTREATIQEIAAAAGMATATVYNHFRTREEVVREVAVWLAETLCVAIGRSHGQVKQGAERMAIGNRRYIWLAEQSPAWAMLLLDVTEEVPDQLQRIMAFPLADLRLGVVQQSFRIESEAAAMNMVSGTVAEAMRSVALGLAPPGHGVAVATTVLRGLGVPFAQAARIASRPLPELVAPEAAGG